MDLEGIVTPEPRLLPSFEPQGRLGYEGAPGRRVSQLTQELGSLQFLDFPQELGPGRGDGSQPLQILRLSTPGTSLRKTAALATRGEPGVGPLPPPASPTLRKVRQLSPLQGRPTRVKAENQELGAPFSP